MDSRNISPYGRLLGGEANKHNMSIRDDHEATRMHEDVPPNGERMSGVNAREVLTRIELESAYYSEKLLNLEILFLQVEDIATDFEGLTLENNDISTECLKRAFEFDILSGILNSEVKELDSFMTSLQIEIADARYRSFFDENLVESSTKTEGKLHDAGESLQQSQDRIADMKVHSSKFERILNFVWKRTRTGIDEEIENGHFSPVDAKWKLQTVEQQRHFLQLLEKSLARELDLEKKLTESRNGEEELRLKVQYAEREVYCMEHSIMKILERMLGAENASELFLGISKELLGKLQIAQFNLNSSVLPEHEITSKLQEGKLKSSSQDCGAELKVSRAEPDRFNTLQGNGPNDYQKEVEDRCMVTNSEVVSFKEKVSSLEEQSREAESRLQLAKVSDEASQQKQKLLLSDIRKMEHVIEDLKDNVLKSLIRAESAEAKCELLTKINMELNEELGLLKNNGVEKATVLEKKLKESDSELEHARASVEAIEEQQSMLYSTLSDMGNLIEDLKTKVSKAENRAGSAESKCALLTETNLELNEELGFLRGRLECMETFMHKADDTKIATAKDIGIRTKFIADLVAKLALERERLQLEIFALTKKNKILMDKCLKMKNKPSSSMFDRGTCGEDEHSLSTTEEASTTFPSASYQVERSASTISTHEMAMEESVSDRGTLDEGAKLETLRTIEPSQLNSKYIFLSIVLLLAALLVAYLLQLEERSSSS